MKVLHCDICYSDKDVNHLNFAYDRIFDGTETTDDYKYFDLCPKCEVMIYREVMRKLITRLRDFTSEFEINKLIIDTFKENKHIGISPHCDGNDGKCHHKIGK